MGRLISLTPFAVIAFFMIAYVARAKPYVLPTEKTVTLPAGPGADRTAATCAACHSLDYVTTQPRGKGEQFWKDSVTKMINVYGAPISKDDANTIATYLGATYGVQAPPKK